MMDLPNHVAIIMDGNGRWAERRGLPRMAGHQAGFNRIRSVIQTILKHNIKYLTVYSFSTENWNRPEDEVQGILNLLVDNIEKEAAELNREGVRMRHLGRTCDLSTTVQEAIQRACALTQNNTRMTFSFAFNYGGRGEIVDTARKLTEEGLPTPEISEKTFAERLYSSGIPDVDLLVRTGGELRISNFLLWQAAYAELYFTRVLWPDFSPGQVERALAAFRHRQRRFGGLNAPRAG
ncbi:MAG: polyprenyl diphosphate synthase [Dehalococcoidales bacterium]|nr:polyprenyl diphosphate synthase [Dehalococcoidales bacterium]